MPTSLHDRTISLRDLLKPEIRTRPNLETGHRDDPRVSPGIDLCPRPETGGYASTYLPAEPCTGMGGGAWFVEP